MPVDRERRIRLVGPENLVDREARRGQFLERAFLKRRRETRRQQQRVLVSEGNLEMLCEAHDHFAAGLRPPGLEVREVARRTIGGEREVRLGHAAAYPPSAKEHSEGKLLSGHGAHLRATSGEAP